MAGAVDGLIAGRLTRAEGSAGVADALCGGVLTRSPATPVAAVAAVAVDDFCGIVLDRAMGVARAVAGSGGVLGCAVVAGAPGILCSGVLARAGAGVRVDTSPEPLAFTSEVAAAKMAAVAPGLLTGASDLVVAALGLDVSRLSDAALALVVAALGLDVSRLSDADFGGASLSPATAARDGVDTGACCAAESGSKSISGSGEFERRGAVGFTIFRKPGRIAGGGCVGGGTEGRCDTACIDG